MRPAAMIRLISTARRTFVCFSSGLRSPKSAKTLPELGTIPVLFLLFSISLLVIFLGLPEPPPDEFHVRLGCFDSLGRFFLEGMQNVYGTFESHRINGPVCIPVMVFDNLQYPVVV